MRVLMVASTFPPVVGGIQAYAFELARHLAAQGAELLVVAPRTPGSEAYDRGAPVPIVRVRCPGDDLAFSGISALRRLLRQRVFDVALTTHWAPGFAVQSAARLAGVRLPLLVAAHGKELIHRPLARLGVAQRVYDAIRRRVLSTADGILAVSRRTAELARDAGAPAGRVSVVHNGVDPMRYTPRPSTALRERVGGDGPLLLSVARLVSRKGIDTVLCAMPQVLERVPDARYAVLGSGPDAERLQRLARELGLGEHVRFLSGLGGDLAEYYNGCDVFVLPAREEPGDIEGFGLVFLEAGACEKPVIGARAGGVVDAVVHGETGLLVPPDDAGALCDAIVQLLSDPQRARAMGQAARARVLREGTWEHAAASVMRALERALAG